MEDEKELDPATINPFGNDELSFVDLLPKDWWEPKRESRGSYPSHDKYGVGTSKRSGESSSKAVLKRLSEIAPQQIEWLWPGRIALGKLTMIAGDPGLGKSLLTAAIAAIVSRGYEWPLENLLAQVGSIVLLSAEDDAADTIRPRLDAAGADCNRIHILEAVQEEDGEGKSTERVFSLKRDLEVLEETLATLPDCRLVVIDPISAYLEGTDSHKNADIRGLLAPLAKLASKHKVAIILVQHLNKNSGESAMYRAMGSVAFIAAARAGFIVTKDKNNPSRRLVMPIKNNLAKEGTGLAYSVLTADNGAPVIGWETEPVEMTADEALSMPKPDDEEQTATDWAIEMLKMTLADGPLPVLEIRKQLKAMGITDKMQRTAREKLGVVTTKSGFESGWIWSLPGHEGALNSEDAQSENEGIFDSERHLGADSTPE